LKQIEIKTSSRISIQFELANLKDRALAFLLDSVILYSLIFVLFFIRLAINDKNIDTFIYVVIIPTFLFYTLLWEIVLGGLTPGKKAMGIRVVKLNGQFARANDYLIRWLFRWVDIWMSLFVIGSVLINSSRYAQRIGDILAGTTVIKFSSINNLELKDILEIEDQENYNPTFPQVVQLNDEDMIIVKRAIHRQQQYRNEAHNKVLLELALHLKNELKIKGYKGNELEFLNTLLKDYIVLTRS